MLNEKETAEELDESYQKRLQKIVGRFLYYDRGIYPTISIALNALAVVHKKPTIDTAKHITQSLNYRSSHLDAVTE